MGYVLIVFFFWDDYQRYDLPHLQSSHFLNPQSIKSPSSLGLAAALLQIGRLDEITSSKKLHS
jgi:hypothetical protein